MSIGDKWATLGMGAMDREFSFKLLDASSEEFIGDWMESRGICGQMFIATKYTTMSNMMDTINQQMAQCVGKNIKFMHISVETSLRRLRTSHIDIFYVRWWDWTCKVEEVMHGLHHLAASGKVLYLGISDAPAWVVSKANIYVLAVGKIRTDAEEEARREAGEKGRSFLGRDWERGKNDKKVAKVLEEVAADVGASTIQAVAYMMRKVPYVFPTIGGCKVEHLHTNMQALHISLMEEHVKKGEDAMRFTPGSPYNVIGLTVLGLLTTGMLLRRFVQDLVLKAPKYD